MREDLTVHNLSREPAGLTLVLLADGDLADLFDVKAGRIKLRGERSIEIGEGAITVTMTIQDHRRGVRVSAQGATAGPEALYFRVAVPERGVWSTTLLALPVFDGEVLPPHFPRTVRSSTPTPRGASRRGRKRARLDVARELLDQGDAGVEHIARRSGLGTATNLRLHFRRRCGASSPGA